MLKLLLCLVCAFAIAVATMQLRQQELELRHRAAKLQAEIESQQAKLWSQQLQIAIYTAPPAMPKTLAQYELELVPEMRPAGEPLNWVTVNSPREIKQERAGL